MAAHRPERGADRQFIRYGAALGAAAGFLVTGVLAGLALASNPGVGLLVAGPTVLIGTVAGLTIGLVSSAVAAGVHAGVHGRVGRHTRWFATVAGAAIAGSGCWLVASRAGEWMQATWVVLAIGVGAGALAAVPLARLARTDAEARSPLAPWVLVGAVGCAGLGIAGAGIAGVGPLADRLGGIKTKVPVVAATRSTDSRVVRVAVRLADDDFCEGQVTVEAQEDLEQVRLTDAVNRVDRNYWTPTICVGYGLVDGIAWVEVLLADQLGDREVVDDDGLEIPFVPG